MTQDMENLFDDFAARWVRGEHPDVRVYLERAGEQREELAQLLDRYIAAATVHTPSNETLAAFDALLPGGEDPPPMIAVRVQMGLGRAEVVRQLCSGLGLSKTAEAKVGSYYSKLETGSLDPRRVSPRVWHTLATVLGGGIRRLMTDPHEPPPVVVAAFTQRMEAATSSLRFRISSSRVESLPALELRESVSEPSRKSAPAEPSRRPAPKPELDEVDRLFLGTQ